MRVVVVLAAVLAAGAGDPATGPGECLKPRMVVAPGCHSPEQLLCVPTWPQGSTGARVNVTVLLPDHFYSVEDLRCVPDGEVALEASYRRVGPAVLAGLEEAARRGWTRGITFNIQFRDSQCNNVLAPKAWEELLFAGLPAHVLFGPSCDFALASVARQIKYWQIPLLTAGGYALDYNRRKTEPTDEFYLLTRTGVEYTGLAKTFLGFMAENKWNKYILMYSPNDRQEWSGDFSCQQFAAAVADESTKKKIKRDAMNMKNLEGAYYSPPNDTVDLSEYSIQQNMTMLRENLPGKNSSIILVCASPARVRALVLAASRIGLLQSGQYVFFTTENAKTLDQLQPWHRAEATNEENSEAQEAFQSVLALNLGVPRAEGEGAMSGRIRRVSEQLLNYTQHDISTLAENFYDAALIYSKALNLTLMEEGKSIANLKEYGEEISRRMVNMTIEGDTGPVRMDSNGDRLTSYAVMALHKQMEQYQIVSTFSPTKSKVMKGLTKVANISWQSHVLCDNPTYKAWQTEQHGSCHSGVPPPDFPVCGFWIELCQPITISIPLVISVMLGVVLVGLVVIGYFVYRRQKEEAEIARMNWKIDPTDIMRGKESRGRFGSKISLMTRGSVDSMGVEDTMRQVFVSTVYYRGSMVAMKPITAEGISLNRALMLELKQMKDLHHDHLTRFVGACLEPGSSFMITEYCPRGSLQDILEDSDFELDTDFRISLINDIVRGMGFLHTSEIRFHGNLKSSNCVVDSRFVLKLTDFGLHELHARPEGERYSHQFYRSRLWTAPELLRAETNLFSDGPPKKVSICRKESTVTRGLLAQPKPSLVVGTPKADVYSFGIILHEIIVRLGTWGTDIDSRAPEEILAEVVRAGGRPKVEHSATDPVLLSIMSRAWAEHPHERIDFTVIRQELRKVNKDMKPLLDTLLTRMEKYADNLETAVKERTQDYLDEKKKCEDLLYELLPKSVASRLIQGQHVVAETFQSVTIYFSDIVGFTALSSSSSPLEVVHMLNDLYTLFDSIIPRFDVYKVETIGDAYMVVSGLPIRNGQNHAREISRMSLEIVEAVKTFRIRHKPDEQLKIRIGLHTGPCCAGVVGIKMPRYCLFGDTVNTSSRMESNGLPLRIHISESTRAALLAWGTFVLEFRGEVEMKGKGSMKTYWLLGENPSLPALDPPEQEPLI